MKTDDKTTKRAKSSFKIFFFCELQAFVKSNVQLQFLAQFTVEQMLHQKFDVPKLLGVKIKCHDSHSLV